MPLARTASDGSSFTVACVPTGMNAGVATSPCGVAISPRRAAPSVARRRNGTASGIGKAYGSVGSREKLLSVPSAKYDLQRLCNHFRLVVRFRSSPQLAARLDANFGMKGPLATL